MPSYIMICLRRATLRVLSSSPSISPSLPFKSQRSIALSTKNSISRSCFRKSTLIAFQRRWASEEATTQSEPEADGATEASHGNNSIAASADSTPEDGAPEPNQSNASSQSSSSAMNDAVETARKTTASAAEQASASASSVTGRVSEAAQVAKASVVDTAQNVGAATGFVERPQEKEPSKTVYVGNLFFDVRSEDLRKEFERAGRVINARIIMDSRGLSKGFGYVEFEDIDSATKAIDLYNLQNFEGRRLSVQYSLSTNSPQNLSKRTSTTARPLHSPTKTLFIGNMSFDMSDRDLNNLFREVKNVVDVRVAIDRRTGQPRGFAHADFIDVKDAERAMQGLQGKEVCGRNLRVDYSTSTGRAAMPSNPPEAEADPPRATELS